MVLTDRQIVERAIDLHSTVNLVQSTNMKKIWTDPVWSKVISAGIIALIAAAYASVHWWTLLHTAAVQSWSYVVGDVVTPRWFFWVLVLWTAGTIIVLALALLDSKGETEAHWSTKRKTGFSVSNGVGCQVPPERRVDSRSAALNGAILAFIWSGLKVENWSGVAKLFLISADLQLDAMTPQSAWLS